MSEHLNVSPIGHLFGDPVRANILAALLDSHALPAGELAYASGVTKQTASSHLSKLLDGGLVTVEKEGRHRYFRLANEDVAEALERLANIQSLRPTKKKPLSRKGRELQLARCCYNHLAGQLGVAVTQSLQRRSYLVPQEEKQFALSSSGTQWFHEIGVNVGELPPSERGFARQCLDWTERQHHLAGPLGVALLDRFSELKWLVRSRTNRRLEITQLGKTKFQEVLEVDVTSLAYLRPTSKAS